MFRINIVDDLPYMDDSPPLKYLLFKFKPSYEKCKEVAKTILADYEQHLPSVGECGDFVYAPCEMWLVGNSNIGRRSKQDCREKLPLPPVDVEWFATRIYLLASKRRYGNYLVIKILPDLNNFEEDVNVGYLIDLDEDLR